MKKKLKPKESVNSHILKKITVFFFLIAFALNVQGQTKTIKGQIIDEQKIPIPGASVLIKGKNTSTITDLNGNFKIDATSSDSLIVSFIGFESKEIIVGDKNQLNIVLSETTSKLDEVVVVGYGTQKKKDLTGGVSTLSGEKLEKIIGTNVASRLQGQIAGVTITSSGNAPGDTPRIRIRGQKSLSGNNDPLIVLNGIPFNGSINSIDENSIENITILKDASSSAIYGARAANGVVLITTKKGTIGKTAINYNGYSGIQIAERLPKLMNGEQNIQLLKDYRKDRNFSDYVTPENWLQTALVDNYKNKKETNWLKETFRPATIQQHQLSLSGATDALNYYTSFTYTNQEGIVKYTGFQKYAATLDLTQKIGNWLKIGTNIQFNQRGPKDGVTPNHSFAYRMSPYSSVRDEQGEYLRYPMWTETLYYSPFANQNAIVENVQRAMYTSNFAEIQLPVKGLSFRSNLGNSYRQSEFGSYYGSNTLSGQAPNGIATISNSASSDWTWENLLLYKLEKNKHTFDFTGLYSAQKTLFKSSNMTAKNFLSDVTSYHNMQMAQGEKANSSDKTETSLLSYMGRINYGYDSKYLLTMSARRDGYSAFGQDSKWALFPSIAAAWVATNEDFIQNLNIEPLDLLKLRLSYGGNGNQGVGAYETITQLSQLDYIYGDGNSFAGGLISGYSYGNPNLKWETTYSTNIGLDLGLFKGRVEANIDYYITNTSDLLMNRTVAVMNGYTSFKDNIGKTKNNGFELMLNTKNIINSNFKWNSALSLAGNWNKIVALREDGKDDIANKWFIGKPISVNYDYRVIGVWQTDEKDAAALYKAVPGDAKLYDKDNDGKITAADREIIGSKLPVWTAGLTNTFSYKNLTLSVFLNGVFDVSKQNEIVKFERQLLEKNANYITGIDYWTAERPSNKFTRLGYASSLHNFYNNVSFVRIQDINLSYEFNNNITKSLGINGLKTYISIKNAYTFSNAKKYSTNIEQDTFTLDAAAYPTQSTFIFGVNLNL